ncbi:NAD-dependent epimerase/dehydratase family protein [Subtercola endophyticus]|uniref:NAD-dependent epimerase/dehydratase family protein n=1 Tax=Subtercola endophyticus TaxID=2895559 RepID=UPI001E54565E|nr:NAD(P)-dependent oxidoreductase [Subtercola endophyticus]UFS60844.1 NAD(P)-dependent oxidoreductase [Subtercola endophyticus]
MGTSRVLVTGASGVIGRAVVARLVASGARVTALSLRGPFPEAADRVIEGDALDPDVVHRAFADVDSFVHLAAIPHPSLGTPLEVFRRNVTATFTVLAEAGERNVRRGVIASSINAFGVPMNTRGVMPAYFPLDERMPADFTDAYSLSKVVDERSLVMAERAWNVSGVALRFPHVGDQERLLRAAAEARADPAASVREGWGYLDVRDAARAVEQGLTRSYTGAHVVGLSAADTLLNAPTEEILARWAPGVPLRSSLPGRSAAIDTTRARELLDFEPDHSMHDGYADHGADPERLIDVG